jgi:hypothetical protein
MHYRSSLFYLFEIFCSQCVGRLILNYIFSFIKMMIIMGTASNPKRSAFTKEYRCSICGRTKNERLNFRRTQEVLLFNVMVGIEQKRRVCLLILLKKKNNAAVSFAYGK